MQRHRHHPARRRAVVRHAPSPAQRRARRAFDPFKAPTKPPAGRYDPALDAAERGSQRGLADLLADIGQGRSRATTDYGLGLGEIERQRKEQISEMDTGLARTREDYGQQTGLIRNQYAQLATQQGDEQAAYGVEEGGTVLAAALARKANQAVDQQPLDEFLSRYTADDATNRKLLAANVASQRGQLGLAYGRQNEDFTTQAARAQREDQQFSLDTGEQRFYQAKLAGYKPPVRPANERVKRGVTYHVRGQGAGRIYTLPSGRQYRRDEWVNLWRHRSRQAGMPGSELRPRTGALRG